MEQQNQKVCIALVMEGGLHRELLVNSIKLAAPNVLVVAVDDGTALIHQLGNIPVPAIILLDMNRDAGDALHTLGLITRYMPQTLALACGPELDPALIKCALENGSRGYLCTNTTLEIFLGALTELIRTGYYLTGLVRQLRDEIAEERRANEQLLATLTTRELEVLKLACTDEELSYKAIAHRLTIAPRTVETHIRKLFEKLGVVTRLGLVHKSLRLGVIDPLTWSTPQAPARHTQVDEGGAALRSGGASA